MQPPEHGLEAHLVRWLRPSEIYEKPSLWGPKPEDPSLGIKAGKLSDMWLLSAMAIITGAPNQGFKKIVISARYAAMGLYVLRIHRQASPICMIVDDRFPCDMHGEPLYCQGEDGAIWPMLVEKACAKMVGSYEGLDHRAWVKDGDGMEGEDNSVLAYYSHCIGRIEYGVRVLSGAYCRLVPHTRMTSPAAIGEKAVDEEALHMPFNSSWADMSSLRELGFKVLLGALDIKSGTKALNPRHGILPNRVYGVSELATLTHSSVNRGEPEALAMLMLT